MSVARPQPRSRTRMPGRNHPASSASRISGDGRDRCQYDAVPSVYGSTVSSSGTHVLLEAAEDLLRCRRHLVDEIAAVEIEGLGPKKAGAGMARRDGDPRREPIREHGAAAGLDQGDGGDLIPREKRALVGPAEDHAFIRELEAGTHRAAHGEEPDQRRRDRRPADASTGEQQERAPHLGDTRQRKEQRPGETRVDRCHATTRTPPGTISARSTLPRWTSPSTSYHWTSGALISTDFALRWIMLLPSARWTVLRGRETTMSSRPSSRGMFGANRKGAAPSMPAFTTSTTTAVISIASPSARMVHSNRGACGSQQAPATRYAARPSQYLSARGV